ncbi:hypothetical protein FHR81_003181 [Actinoalloteichus hoggarensis]|uniref:Uncharacterized protein n=1 Tax=Actinoalloteichus hoggarensis TaxID=1470176 RepID=A0A221W6L6_9PSEU|nr:hypothetical protein AHOG_19580 [Actinoalloteichus hoggarensis]MBB5922129.1 hypothetical protein [Actinoalloteichus hoggarensis]
MTDTQWGTCKQPGCGNRVNMRLDDYCWEHDYTSQYE